MKKTRNAVRALILTFVLLFGMTLSAHALSPDALAGAVEDTAAYLFRTVSNPQVGSIGGEWAVLGLARSGYPGPERYYETYYRTVEKYVQDCGGILHNRKYTEYSRVIAALSAIGKDARNVAGYDLTKALGDYDNTVWQGLNGPIWALIALDSADYPMPQNPEAKTQATRQLYIDRILDCQLSDGGWSLNSAAADCADPDITGMALQALAKYRDQPRVAQAIEEALVCMSARQAADGGFSSWGTANSESAAQMTVALCELGIPLDDSRFVKNGNTILDNLMTFYRAGSGFVHTQDGSGVDQMAAEQGFYALVAAKRMAEGKNSLYRMSDAVSDSAETAPEQPTSEQPVPEKPVIQTDVRKVPVSVPGKTFADIQGHAAQTAVEALAARGIINGKSETSFDPDAEMTRAEFAAIVVRSLGLTPEATDAFSDVTADKWYAAYIGTASSRGIVNGVGGGKFNPSGTITRQEAAAMVARAAKLCGLDPARSTSAIRDTLSPFADYTKTADWARESLAFCYGAGILDDSALTIDASAAIRRCEIAQMLYRLLELAELL